MRRTHQAVPFLLAVTLGAALPSAAQEPPAAEDALTPLQGKNVLTDEDAAAVRAWVTERVQAIAARQPDEPAGPAANAAIELRERYKGTDSFKRAYAAAATETIGAAYKRAKRDSAAQLLAVLNTLGSTSTVPLLIEALGDQRVPVRSAAAIGLSDLKEKMASAGGTLVSESVAALRDAGKRETSPVALKLIYQAMDYTNVSPNPDRQGTTAALLALLEARGEQYAGRNVKAEGADRAGLETAAKLLGQLDEPSRQRLAIATARMLHYAVTRYTSALCAIQDGSSSRLQIALRDRMELFIASTESLLSKLTPPPTKEGFKTVTTEMQDRPQGDKATYMKIAMNTWADTLQNRFQIDVHMDVTAAPEEDKESSEKPSP